MATPKENLQDKNLISEILFPSPHMPGIKAEEVFKIADWPISNTTTFLWFITFLFLLFIYAIRNFRQVPGFFQSLVELFMEVLETLLSSLTNGRAHRVKQLLFPITAIFLIIGSINIIGSFPIINQITILVDGHLIPLFRKSTSDINITLPLALTVVLSMQYFGVLNWGFFGYFKRFFPIVHWWTETRKHGFSGFLLGFIEMFIALIEFISEGIKVVSLSLRLFGNMFAGEVVLVILMGAFAILVPVVWIGFDLMVAVIQTLVFGCLTAVYYTMVIKEPDQQSH